MGTRTCPKCGGRKGLNSDQCRDCYNRPWAAQHDCPICHGWKSSRSKMCRACWDSVPRPRV